MSQEGTQASQEPLHFFISYTSSDRQWAEWISMQLELGGYTLAIQAWDFRPGSNFVAEMDRAAKRAERTLLVLSPAYLLSDFAFSEWAAAFSQDPRGTQGKLLPVRVEPCEVEGLLGQVVSIDLVSLDETQARERLLEGVKQGRAKPATAAYPGQHVPHAHASFPGSLPTLWNIPYLRNPVFTGREQLLAQLAEQLKPGEAVALAQPQAQAISGLGGIGKTQLAVEYAYRHRQDYQAVFWTRADTADALIEGYGAIARLLQLSEQEEQDQSRVVKAVQEWLRTKSGWLLILDNADDLTLVRTYLPPTFSGHILLTTRAQSMGRLAARIEVHTLDRETGALLLLRRAGVLAVDALLETASPSDLALARAMTEEVGGLPLALDQAGAYIEETACGLREYHQRYHTRAAELLGNRGGMVEDHPEPVATTWSLSFAQVEERNPAAADLLRLCAFLAPDAIPEELLTEGAKKLGAVLAPVAADPYLLDQAITALRAYSLLTRDPQAHTLSVHRLVQAVLRDSLPRETQRHWMQRAVQVVNTAFPDIAFANWPTCERLLPHAFTCATWIEQASLFTSEASRLLNQAGVYLHHRGRYGEAEPLYLRALAIYEQQLGAEHPDTATSLNNLAELYKDQGKYAQAEPLYLRALAICEQQLGAEHPDTATSLNNLAALYQSQGKYAQATPLFQRALTIREQTLGREHPSTALSVWWLATLFEHQQDYQEAQALYERALATYEQSLGPEHPSTQRIRKQYATLRKKMQREEDAP